MGSASQPIIVTAPSGKSRCKACRYLGSGDATIEMGSQRVGIPGHAAGGVTVYHWCHPACFAQHCLRVDHAPTGRARCKGDGSEIAKGTIRLLVGYKKESTVYKLDNTNLTIVPRLIELAGTSNVTIHGMSELSLDERLRVEGAIFTSGAGDRGGRGASGGGGGGTGSGDARGRGTGEKRSSASASSAGDAAPRKRTRTTATTRPTATAAKEKALARQKPAARTDHKDDSDSDAGTLID